MNRNRNLPPEVVKAMKPKVDAEEVKKNFAITLAAKREEAIKSRKASGIEEQWMYCEEAYVGIDDVNRAEFAGARWAKPTTMEGPLMLRGPGGDGVKTTGFVPITARYVDAGAAKIGEITDPIDDKPFNLKPTPIPELIKSKEDLRQILDNGQPVMRPATEEELAAPQETGPDGQPIPVPQERPLTVADLAKHQLEKAADAAKKAEDRIYDWLVESGHSAQMRKVRFDAARIGTGVLKGPVPVMRKAQAAIKTDQGFALQIEEKIAPSTNWVDPWNFFPAPDCGENIHDGSYVFERDFLSRGKLRALKKQPGYDPKAIDKVLEEGPGKCDLEDANSPETRSANGIDRNRFEIWYFYGEISKDDLCVCNPGAAERVNENQDDVFVIVTMVNDTPIRTVLNPLDSGSFPYHVANWRRRAGHWAGVGIAEQVKFAQKITNSATRAMLNNAGKSAGSQIVIGPGLEPADGNWQMTPDKIYRLTPGAEIDDVRKAFFAFQIPNMTPQLLSVIEYGFKLAEESSNLPLISQGQSGKTTPDTFSGQQLQDNNANQLLRDVGFAFADQITDPLIRQMYEWLLLDPEVPEEEKGDFNVDVSAAMAMIERAIQDQAIVQMGQLVGNPAFKIDPSKWFIALAKTKRLDPRDFQYSEEDQEKMEQNQQPPLPIAIQQLKNESAEKIAAQREQTAQVKIQTDTDRDTAYVRAQRERDMTMADAEERKLMLQREIALLTKDIKIAEFALKRETNLENAKVELSKTAMELSTQKELAGVEDAKDAKQVASTEMEPVGRAPDGQAFQR